MTIRTLVSRAALLLVAASLTFLSGCCCDHSCPANQQSHPAAKDGKEEVYRSPGPRQGS